MLCEYIHLMYLINAYVTNVTSALIIIIIIIVLYFFHDFFKVKAFELWINSV